MSAGWKGAAPARRMQVADLVRNSSRRFPDRACIAEGDRSLTFAEVDARATQLASAFAARGIRPGARIALLAENELEYLEIQVAAQRAGLILVPLNFRLALPELAYIVGDAQPDLLIHGPGYADAASQLDCPATVHLGAEGHGIPYDDALAGGDPSGRGDDRLAAERASSILYTSGTTGRPKGAVLSNMALYARCSSFAIEHGARPGSVFVQTLPMFHISAHTAYSFVYVGSTIVLMKDSSPPALVDTLHARRATHLLMVPATINMFCNHPGIDDESFDDLQLVLYGASPIAPDVLRRAITVFNCGFLQLFGMTETSACTMLRPGDHDPVNHPELLSSAGTDAVSFETKIVRGDGDECAIGEVGEIVTSGPALMTEYWNAEEATNAALRDGWMHTGDLGYRAADGYVFVTDRLKDMIVTGGENVYPREVEDVLYSHPAVLEAAVIGLADARWGERVHALVVARPGEVVDPDELVLFAKQHLAAYKCPKTVEVVPELVKNATGKILKRQLREQRAANSPLLPAPGAERESTAVESEI